MGPEAEQAVGPGMGSSKSTRRAGQAWGKAAATPSPGDPLPQPRLGTPRAHLPIAPRTPRLRAAGGEFQNAKEPENLTVCVEPEPGTL